MKILVTGGAGFIGSHIQDKLIELGHEVGILDNLRSGKKANLNPKSQFFEIDIRHRASVKSVFEKFPAEAVFHLAAQNEVPYSMDHHYEDEEANIIGMMNLLETAHEFGTKKIVYSNTGGALYGEVPDSHLPITEDEPILRPTSFYGVSKGCAEWYLKLYGNLYGLGWVSLRYSNVYGPRQAGNRETGIVAIFTEKLLEKQVPTIFGDGLHTRDYIYVGDVVDANIAVLNYPQNNYFNISTGKETSNNTVFTSLESLLKTGLAPSYAPNRPGDPRRNSLNPAKAAQLLNWSSKVSFDDGVRLTLEFYGHHAS